MTKRVMDYQTGDFLKGAPSDELVTESDQAQGGVVPAYRDEAGVWQYVAPSDRDRIARAEQVCVLSVWVDD